jgi:GNAT superfamily N-acetyltransferase
MPRIPGLDLEQSKLIAPGLQGAGEVAGHIGKSVGVQALSGIKGLSVLPQGTDAAAEAIREYQKQNGPSMDLSPHGIQFIQDVVAPIYNGIGTSTLGKLAHNIGADYGEGVQKWSDLAGKYLGPGAAGAVGAAGNVLPFMMTPEGMLGKEAAAAAPAAADLASRYPRAYDGSSMHTLQNEGHYARQAQGAAISVNKATDVGHPTAGLIGYHPNATVIDAHDPATMEHVGRLVAEPTQDGTMLQGRTADVFDEANRRQGIGTKLLSRGVDHAHENGMDWGSDVKLSPGQVATYMKLQERGYPMEFNPSASVTEDHYLTSGDGKPVLTIRKPTDPDTASLNEPVTFDPNSYIRSQAGDTVGAPGQFHPASPEDFIAARGASKRPSFLTSSSAEDLASHRLFLSPDKTVGYAIDPKGDLQNVFNNGGPKGSGRAAVDHAIANGATTLDAFDGYLPNLYAQHGFEAYGRMPFNREYAPPGWDYAAHGEPDVVFMRHTGNTQPYQSGTAPLYDDYDAAKAAGSDQSFAEGGVVRRAGGTPEGGEIAPLLDDIGALVAKYAKGAPNEHAAQLASHVADTGGVTYNPTSGEIHSSGYAVPTEPSRSVALAGPPEPDELHDFMLQNQEAFQDPKAALHVESDEHGNHFLHVAQIHPDYDSAMAAALDLQAPGVRELHTGKNFSTDHMGPRIGGSEPDPAVEDYLAGSSHPPANSPAELDPERNQRPNSPWTPGQPTVENPQRVAFPGIYGHPKQVIADANAMVGPQDPLLQRLFGVDRQDLSDIALSRQGNELGVLPGAKPDPTGAASARAVMTPQNEQRLIDVLTEARGTPLHTGMTGWYTMDPLYHRFVEIFGEDEAPARYHRFNTLMGMASPGSDVGTEIARGTSANWLHNQGRFEDFLNYAGVAEDKRASIPGFPADMMGVPGHAYHPTAQAGPMADYLRTGSIQMKSPKVPMYIGASGVPETGFQSDLPVGDAHWARGVGLADTRNWRTKKGERVVPGSSVSTPEMQALAPWWRDRVAAQAGYQAVPAQATAWGAFAPATGVESKIGAPKLEILSTQIGKLANRLGISPETARDLVISGNAGAY